MFEMQTREDGHWRSIGYDVVVKGKKPLLSYEVELDAELMLEKLHPDDEKRVIRTKGIMV